VHALITLCIHSPAHQAGTARTHMNALRREHHVSHHSKSGRVDESQIQRRLETGTGCRVTANVAPLKRQINKPHSLFTKSVCPMHTRRPSKTSARPTSLLHPRCASSVAGLRARRCAALLAGGTAVHQLLAFAVQPAAALLRRCADLDGSPAAQLQQVTDAQRACAKERRAYER